MEILNTLLTVSERAANIARCCRSNDHLVELLVQEKSGFEKNPRFFQDFKTLADVLIQETVRHVVGNQKLYVRWFCQFPDLQDHIYGEESAVFTNTLGESVQVVIMESKEATADMLCKVLDNDRQAAEVLAHEVHHEVSLNSVNIDQQPGPALENLKLDWKNLGIWIDPIDSTAEYIGGEDRPENEDGISTGGLKCVTVLIGVFDEPTGTPILGVINQPFYEKCSDSWRGHTYWGIHYTDFSMHSIPPSPRKINKIVLLSSSEKAELKENLKAAGYTVFSPPGAGYKLLCVALGVADSYILSKSSTFQWDTCAPHAVLLAHSGGIASYNSLCRGQIAQIEYNQGRCGKACNETGIVAYRDIQALNNLLQIFN